MAPHTKFYLPNKNEHGPIFLQFIQHITLTTNPNWMKKVFFRMLLVLLSFAAIAPQTFAASMPVHVTPNPEDPAVKQALMEFNNLSSKEKKARIKETKKAIKKLKADKKAGIELETSKVLEIIFAILLPPLGIYLHEGEINNRFWICLLLTLLFFIPGMVYALIIVLSE